MPNGWIGTDRVFVDTNVLVYAQDPRDPAKRARALDAIQQLSGERRMVVSMQVVAELCAVLLKGKAGSAVDPADLSALVDEAEATAEIITLTPAMAKDAVRAVATYALSWYDALIWAAARAGGCPVFYTEDVPGRPEVEGVRYVNPLVGP